MDTDKREAAEQDYLLGMKQKEIAEKYGVSIDTVKSWRKRYEWGAKGAPKKGVQKGGAKSHETRENQGIEAPKGASKKGVHPTTTKKGVQKGGAKGVQNEAPESEFEPVPENGELTDKQRLFCSYYVRCFNATKAYQKAYGVTYETASKISYRMMGNDGIKNEIQRLRCAKLKKENLKVEDVFQKYLDIAFSDITDYVEFGRESVPVMGAFGPVLVEDKETGEKKELKKEVNVVRFKESAVVDGTLITEVRQGKDSASIKLADKMKALEWITEHMATVDGDIVIKVKSDKKFDG